MKTLLSLSITQTDEEGEMGLCVAKLHRNCRFEVASYQRIHLTVEQVDMLNLLISASLGLAAVKTS